MSLIGFGFTIFQFFERLNAMKGVAPALRPQTPRYLALALIGAGTMALAISLWQYRRLIGYLWGRDFASVAGVGDPATTPILWITILLILIGAAAFAAVLRRIS